MVSVRLSGCTVFLFSILYPPCHNESVLFTKENIERRGVYIGPTKRTWENAAQSCTLYDSDKASSYVASVQDITFHPHTNITPRPENLYWIGATATFTPWFELLGCYIYTPIPTNQVLTLRNLSTVIGPVADCYLQCGNHFGVNDTHCVCPKKLKQGLIMNRTCKLSTSHHFQSDVIGTSTEGPYYIQIAIYKIYHGTFSLKESSLDECLRMSTTDDVRTYPCDTADRSGHTWTTAVTEGLSSNKSGSLQWTRYVRRRLMRWTQGTVPYQNTSACVSVRKIESEKYETVLRPCDDQLFSICQREETSNSERSTNRMLTSSSPTDPDQPTSTVQFAVVSTMYPVTENGGYDEHVNLSVETGSLPVIVGGVVGGALLLLIVVVIGIVRLKRRTHSTPQSVFVATENVYYSELTQNIEDQTTPQRSSHRYTGNENDEMSGSMSQSTDRAIEDHTLLPTSDDGVYNHTWDKPMTEHQSDHVYSTTCSRGEYAYSQVPGMSSDVYNHTWDKPITEQLTDHVYSTTGSGNDAKLYDHTDLKESNLAKVNNENYSEPLRNIYSGANNS